MFGHDTWPLAKDPEVVLILSLYLSGSKLSVFLLYVQRFPRCRLTFKIAIFGQETWPLAKVTDAAHIPTFYPRGSKLSIFPLYEQRFPRYGTIFKIAICSMKLGHWPKFQKLCIYSPSGRSRLSLFSFFALQVAVSRMDTGRFSKLPYLGMKLGHWSKFQKLHIYSLSTLRGQN